MITNGKYLSADSVIPADYVPVPEIELSEVRIAASTVIPDGYTRCPDNVSIRTFPPFLKWLKMITKEKTVNTPKKGGVHFEEDMDDLLDQAQEILTVNAKRK